MSRVLALLRVRPVERGLALRVLALMVVLWSTTAIGGIAVESQLLARVGADALPTMYILLGVATFATMAATGRISRADPRGAVPAAYVGIAAVVAALRMLLAWDSEWAFRLAWLVMMILWSLSGLLSWSLAGALHDTRQAKRLFPLYGAGLVVGLVLGGFLTGPLASAIGPEQLVFVWAGGAAAAAVLARACAAAGRPAGATGRAGAPPGFLEGFRAVRAAPLLRWMAVSLALFALLFFALTFLFARAAAARYPDPERLAGFLGAFSGAATGAALLVSLVLANRVFARIGTVNAVLILAALYLAGFGALAVASSFALVAALRFAQIVWVNGVWAPGWQSMFNVVPGRRRPAVRAFMDAVPLQLGVIGAGGLLLLAERALPPRAIAGIGAGAAAVAVFALTRARGAYVRALTDALREGYPEVFDATGSPFAGSAPDREAIAAAVAGTEDPDPARRRLAVELLAATGAPEGAPALRARLQDEDPAVRAAAGAAIWDAPAGLDALGDPDPGMRAAGATALGRASTAAGADVIGPLLGALGDEDPAVAAAAGRSLAALGEPAVPGLLEVLDDPGREEPALEALRGVGTAGSDPLLPYARDRARTAARFASLARAVAGPGEPAALLAAALEERSRRSLRLALKAMGRGRPEAIRPVLDNLWRADADQRANAIEVVEAVGNREVARLLMGIWESEAPAGGAAAALTELLSDPDPWLRACAAGAVAESAEADRLALGLRRMAGSDPEAFVREAAARALEGAAGVETLATLSLMDRAVCLRRVPVFAALDSDDLHRVAEAATEHAFEDGETLAEEGTPGDALYVVVSGEVSVVVGRNGGDGGRREVAVRRVGEHVGEMALIGDEPRMASLIARGPVRTLGLDRARFERIVHERPAVALGVIRVLGERLRESARSEGA